MDGSKPLTIAAIAVILATGAACARVSAGHVGIKSTYTGSGKGLEELTVGPAWANYNLFTESVFEYPTFVQTVVWTKSTDEGRPTNEEISFTNKDSMLISADISLAYSLVPERVPAFYLKFRSDNLETFTDGFLRNLAREKFNDVAGRYTIEQVMGDNGPMLAEVKASLQKDLDPIGVHLEQFGFIGAPRPPQAVIDSISAKVKAVQLAQQKQNEVLQAQADAAKQVAQAEGQAKATLTLADSQAQANRKLAESITPTLIEYRKLDKWNGQLPQVSGSSGGIIVGLGSK